MKIVFFGSDEFSLTVLKYLVEKSKEEIFVVTVPDSKQGRGKKLTPSPVKEFCCKKGIEVYTPDNPNTEEFVEKLRKIKPHCFILASYRFILKKDILSIVRYPLNIHPSLLPKYRGSAPIQRAIMDGEEETGVTIFIMDENIDTGRMVLQKRILIGKEETYGELRYRLALLGGSLVLEAIGLLEKEDFVPAMQKGKAIYAKKIRKKETFIKWEKSAVEIKNLVRALNPKPVARSYFRNKSIQIFIVDTVNHQGKPAEVLAIKREGPVVGTGKGAIVIKEVKIEGKKKITGREFCNGYRINSGEKFG